MAVSSKDGSDRVGVAAEVVADPAVSSNPLAALSNLDPSKKYTLVFLMSVGTTLLVTGFSGGRLLKRAKTMTAEPVAVSSISTLTPSSARPAANSSILSSAPSTSSSSLSPLRLRNPIASTSTLPHTSSLSSRRASPALMNLAASFPSAEPQHRSLLQQWSKEKGSDLSYWLSNTSLASDSAAAVAASEAYDKQGVGYEDKTEGEEEPYVDDGFNPAVFAAKAFAIASVLTVGTFGIAIAAVMKWYEVSDLESLSLALSHSLPPVLEAHRPAVPAWAQPAAKEIEIPGAEEDSEDHKEGVAYWVEVKEILDREAAEQEIERRQKWERLKGARA